MSAQLHFTQSDIWSLPFKTGDRLKYKGKEVTVTSIYIRPFGEGFINDIIVTFTADNYSNYTFHDDYELTALDGRNFYL